MYLQMLLFIALLFNSQCLPAETTNSEICCSYLWSLATGVFAEEDWALDMLDASSKFPAGLRSGNVVDLGSFDQCLAIDNKNGIKGKYCFVTIDIFNNTQPANRVMVAASKNLSGPLLAWCIPDACDIANITNEVQSIIELPVISVGFCQTKDNASEEFSASDWAVIGFLIFILVLMVLSTLYDIYIQYNEKEPAHLILIAFSILTNGKKLLVVSHHPDQIPCLHGIRSISMMWVVLGHKYSVVQLIPLLNFKDKNEWTKSVSSRYIISATVSVDTFFVLNGLLISYEFLLAKEKGTQFNILLYYIRRYIRLTPGLAVMVLISATIIEHIGSGPYWPLASKIMKDNCVEWWWSALLYIQNYVNNSEMCSGPSWYLSVDTQLYVLAPILLIPLWKWPRYTMYFAYVLVLSSIAIPLTMAWVYELPGLGLEGERVKDFGEKYYTLTHTRFGPWLMGLMLGYYIYKLKRRRKDPFGLYPSIICGGWLVAITTMTSVVYASNNMLHHDYNRWESSIYIGLHRHAWSLGICWVIYACTQGYGGPINSFLSWSLFHVLGRLTFCMYLNHANVQIMRAGKSRTNIYFTDFDIIHEFWGDYFFTLFLAVCLSLSFETPMLVIEKIIFKPGKKPTLPVHQHETANGQNAGDDGQRNKAFNKD